MSKLRDFVLNNINWDGHEKEYIEDDHIITEAVVLYRAVRPDPDSDELSEMYNYLPNKGASYIVMRGMGEIWRDDLRSVIENLPENDEDDD